MSDRPYVIITDSTCDLPREYVEANHLAVMQISYSLDGEAYDGIEHDLSPKDFYDKMRKGSMPQTQQITPVHAQEVFQAYLEKGMDILVVAFSSGLSGTYNSYVSAAAELKDKFPEGTIRIVDSLSASVGEGLFVHKALELQKKGLSIEDAEKWLTDNCLHLTTYFTVDDLFHLHRGGRVSKTAAVFGSMLSIKPVLHVSNEGLLIPTGKVRGRKQSLVALVDAMESLWLEEENDVVFISHGDCEADARQVADLIRDRLKVKNFLITGISPVVGSHSGPGTIALAFMGKNR